MDPGRRRDVSLVRLRCVRVFDDHVDFILESGSHTHAPGTAEQAVARLLEWLPGLRNHRCSTGGTRSFAEEMLTTEVAHLFEHVVLEVLVRVGSTDEVRGETVWRKGEDAYLVSINDDDDVVCIAAARLALRLIDSAFSERATPDTTAEIARIAALR